MSHDILAERCFTASDQQDFAVLSGDRNPMHMDAIAARRSMAGFPVVHGIHAMLWGLDNLFRVLACQPAVMLIRASFEKMIYVGDHVQVALVKQDDRKLCIELIADGTMATRLDIALGEPRPSQGPPSTADLLQPSDPLALSFEQMGGSEGRVPFFTTADEAARLFPAAAAALSAQRVAGLACSSFIVGMVCPGLHSIYRSLSLAVTPMTDDNSAALDFKVIRSDPRFRLVRLAISGAGWVGSIDAHARPEPTAQPDMASLAKRIAPGEFSGASALVIGGSRGLGELTAKILAAGGADVTLTYTLGEADARRVQSEITAHGSRCGILRYNVRDPAGEQLAAWRTTPNQIYYMATPTIFVRKSAVFVRERLREFLGFYVEGFYDLCQSLRLMTGANFSAFYPSSVSVDDRPGNMTEYTMAKAAGEILCADMQSFGSFGPILVRRLPRLPTDQTASLQEVETMDPIDVMLPIIREVHANRHINSAAS